MPPEFQLKSESKPSEPIAGDSLSDKLCREGRLALAAPRAIADGFGERAQDAWHNKGATGLELGLSVAAGFLLSRAGEGSFIRFALGGLSKLAPVFIANDLTRRVIGPLYDVWTDKSLQQVSEDRLGRGLGSALFDYSLLLASSKLGSGIQHFRAQTESPVSFWKTYGKEFSSSPRTLGYISAGYGASYWALGDDHIFADKNPAASIKPDAVFQGGTGDCYFLAALSSVAATKPELIQNAVTERENGSFDVHFAGLPTTIRTTGPNPIEQIVYAHGSTHGAWCSLLEKAYGTHANDSKPLEKRSFDPSDGAGGGGYPDRAISDITGHQASTYQTADFAKGQLIATLEQAYSQHRASCASSDSKNPPPGIIGNHAYGIIGFTKDHQIRVRNPWGTNSATGFTDGTGGELKLTEAEFKHDFPWVYIEQNELRKEGE